MLITFQVAGTIVTYELVLIQFHTDDEKPTLCNGIDKSS